MEILTLESVDVRATLTNSKRDSVTVGHGGIGGDNVQGHVYQYVSGGEVPVAGATVRVTNTTNNETAEERTNQKGWYDIDVNASTGDRVFVHVQWQSNGAWHVVSGYVVLRGRNADGERGLLDSDFDPLAGSAPQGAVYLEKTDDVDLKEPPEAPAIREVTITPDVILPPAQTLKKGQPYTRTIVHTLFVANDDKQVLQGDMIMTFAFPGVIEKPKTWQLNVYVKRRKSKAFRFTTTVRGIEPGETGTFSLVGRTEFLGKVQEKIVEVKVVE